MSNYYTVRRPHTYVDIKNQQELSKIITLCRKKGVESFKISENGIEFKLRDLPPPRTRSSKKASLDEATEDRQAFTADEILFWSSAGVPDMNVEGN